MVKSRLGNHIASIVVPFLCLALTFEKAEVGNICSWLATGVNVVTGGFQRCNG